MTREAARERIASILVENFEIERSRVTPDATFRGSLGLDSLDVVDLVFFVQRGFGFEAQLSEFHGLETVDQVAAFVVGKVE
jgi:acyl carrier protein